MPCDEHITAKDAVDLFDREICKRSCRGQPLIIKCDRDARFTKAAFSQMMKLGGRQFQELTFPSCEMIVDDPYQLTIRAEESTNQVSKSFLVVSVQLVDQLPRI